MNVGAGSGVSSREGGRHPRNKMATREVRGLGGKKV